MRSIGVFRSSATSTFASQTNAHNGFYAMNRMLTRHVSSPSLPKVGVMQSSQRTQLRSMQPLGIIDLGGAQKTVVNDAIRRVRNDGTCAPKKKGANRS